MDSKGKASFVKWGLAGAALLFLLAVNVFGDKGKTHDAAAVAQRAEPAAEPKEVPEIERPGSKEFLALLKSGGLFHTLVIDFAHHGLSPDRIDVVVADEYQDGSKGQRRDLARKLQTIWAMARAAEQPDGSKCSVLISSRAGRVLAHSDYGGRGDVIVLRDDE